MFILSIILQLGWPTSATAIGLKPLLQKKDRDTPVFPDEKIGSCGLPVPGSKLAVFVPKTLDHHDDAEHQEWEFAQPNTMGNIVLLPPLPPGALRSLSNDIDGKKLHKAYYERVPGAYDTSDAGFIDKDGFVSVMGRVDDVINVAGHRLSTGAIEACVSSHSSVAECCVIGAKDSLKGERPIALIVLKHLSAMDSVDTIKEAIVKKIRLEIGAFASLRTSEIYLVDKLPKTRSGKILRRSLRNLVNGEKVMIPPTIEDPAVIDQIRVVFAESVSDH